MSANNVEGMKKIIAEKKKMSAQQNHNSKKPSPKMANQVKAFKKNKTGGLFDK
ncbi:MAG: hypothetical protein JXQ26_00695 [Tissierellales bacterium]|jgi:hypothetical protein|nr:hypothetical protein [Tissierellales bacterium]MBN2826474.1 hypothetical protein [Tissierellales bacterium]